MTHVLLFCSWGLSALAVVLLVYTLRVSRRRQRDASAALSSLSQLADERATALDYIVRARVVDYIYEYVGYQVRVGCEQGDEVQRIMVFGPPHNKDIICKRITLAEGQKAPGVTSVREFSFEASVYKPLPELFEDEVEARIDPHDESAWQFDSHPWVLDVPPDETNETRAILVFTPMISDTRRLKIRYRWPTFFPRLKAGALSAQGQFSILKQARLLEFSVSLPEEAPHGRLTMHPPGGREAIESAVADGMMVCSLVNAHRGTYRYVITLAAPLTAKSVDAPAGDTVVRAR